MVVQVALPSDDVQWALDDGVNAYEVSLFCLCAGGGGGGCAVSRQVALPFQTCGKGC